MPTCKPILAPFISAHSESDLAIFDASFPACREYSLLIQRVRLRGDVLQPGMPNDQRLGDQTKQLGFPVRSFGDSGG
jgi:hypothetical protein